MSANTVDIRLHGKEFRIACVPEQKEDLLAAAAFLDWKMGEIARQTKSSAGEKLAVMTALNLAHELIGSKELANVVDVSEVRRKIDTIEARLDAVLALQEELF
jgi:cell division protein ZapA